MDDFVSFYTLSDRYVGTLKMHKLKTKVTHLFISHGFYGVWLKESYIANTVSELFLFTFIHIYLMIDCPFFVREHGDKGPRDRDPGKGHGPVLFAKCTTDLACRRAQGAGCLTAAASRI